MGKKLIPWLIIPALLVAAAIGLGNGWSISKFCSVDGKPVPLCGLP